MGSRFVNDLASVKIMKMSPQEIIIIGHPDVRKNLLLLGSYAAMKSRFLG